MVDTEKADTAIRLLEARERRMMVMKILEKSLKDEKRLGLCCLYAVRVLGWELFFADPLDQL